MTQRRRRRANLFRHQQDNQTRKGSDSLSLSRANPDFVLPPATHILSHTPTHSSQTSSSLPFQVSKETKSTRNPRDIPATEIILKWASESARERKSSVDQAEVNAPQSEPRLGIIHYEVRRAARGGARARFDLKIDQFSNQREGGGRGRAAKSINCNSVCVNSLGDRARTVTPNASRCKTLGTANVDALFRGGGCANSPTMVERPPS